MMKTSRIISRIILATISMFVFASCSKENGDSFFRFNKEGGEKEFAIEFDEGTISIQSKGDAPQKAYFIEDNANPDNSQWFAELNWCRVYYTPAKRVVYVSVDENTSGVDRNATIMGSFNGNNTLLSGEKISDRFLTV